MIALTRRSTRARYAGRGRERDTEVLNVVYETADRGHFTTTQVVDRSGAEAARQEALHHTLMHPAARPVDAYISEEPIGRFRLERHGGRWRTGGDFEARALSTFQEHAPEDGANVYGFLLPSGRIVDIGNQQHFVAAREMGSELGLLQARGFARFLTSVGADRAHPHLRQVYVETTTPLTSGQQRTLRDIEANGPVIIHLEASRYPPGQYTSVDQHMLSDGHATDAIQLRRLIAETNAAVRT